MCNQTPIVITKSLHLIFLFRKQSKLGTAHGSVKGDMKKDESFIAVV